MGVRWFAALAALLFVGCNYDFERREFTTPALAFGCEADGYSVSPRFTPDELASIAAGAKQWNATHSTQVTLHLADDDRCAFAPPASAAGFAALQGATLPADYYGAITSTQDQRMVLALPCDAGCRARVTYWGISQLAGIQWDHERCISGGDCPP